MRAFVFTCVVLLSLNISPLHANEPVEKNSPANHIAQELQEAYSQRLSTGVRFVVGNDLWQPQRRFKAGRDWLALLCGTNGCSLEPAILKTKQELWQGHYDDKPTSGQHLNFKTEAGTSANVVAWFSTVPQRSWLKPGPVTTYYSPRRAYRQQKGRGTLEAIVDLPNGESTHLVPLLATKAFLKRLQPEQGNDWPIAVLQLRQQHKRQLLQGMLGTCSGTFHPRDYLLWVGDLDRDAKPDYLISFVDADGPVHLYLSSVAKPNRLVGLGGAYDSSPFGGECDGPGGFMMESE